MFRLIGAIFALLGVALLVAAFAAKQQQDRFCATAKFTDGRVIDLIPQRNSKGTVTWAPKVEFVDLSGHSVVFVSSTAAKPPSYKIGESVRVAYAPDRPASAEVDTFFARWGLPIILGGMGGTFAILGTVLVIGRRRQAAALQG